MTEEDDGHVHDLHDEVVEADHVHDLHDEEHEDDEEVCDVPGVTAEPGSAPPLPGPGTPCPAPALSHSQTSDQAPCRSRGLFFPSRS